MTELYKEKILKEFLDEVYVADIESMEEFLHTFKVWNEEVRIRNVNEEEKENE